MTITYHRLTLIEKRVGKSSDGHILSLWMCECGEQALIAFSRVKSGTTKSCGCLGIEVSSLKATKHGGRNTREYSSWMAMRRRCEDPNDKDYPRYGGRGINVYPEWSASFAAFRDAMGPRPLDTTLDRIDASLGYIPGNVRWATPKVQGRNRRRTSTWHIKGQTFESIGEAASAFGVAEQTIWKWVKGNFDRRRGTFTPPRPDCSAVERYQ